MGRVGRSPKLVWLHLREQGKEPGLVRSLSQAEGWHRHAGDSVVWIFHQCQMRENLGSLSSHGCKEEKWEVKFKAVSKQQQQKMELDYLLQRD